MCRLTFKFYAGIINWCENISHSNVELAAATVRGEWGPNRMVNLTLQDS